VNHRHLLDSEIDLLVDGEVGFGVAPLRAHLGECAECRAAYDRERALVAALEQMPHALPSSAFAERVMSEVRVFEPWHVTVLDAGRRWMPASRPLRVVAAAGASVVALLITAVSALAVMRADTAVFLGQLGFDRLRAGLATLGRELASAALGPDAAASLGTGGATWGMVVAAAIGTALVAALGLRFMASSARRVR
jgi:anti-sigma factor RsiW